MKNLLKVLLLVALACITATISYSQSGPNLRCTKFIDSYNGGVAADNGNIMVTTNSGAQWISIPTGYTENLYCLHQLDPLTMISIGQNGLIIKSNMGMSTWTQIPSGVTTNLRSMDKNSSGSMIIAGDNGVMLYSNDMGDTWTPVQTPGSINLYQVIFISDTKAIAVGDNSTILRSIDGGLTWEMVSLPSMIYAVNFYSVAFDQSGLNGVIVGDNQTVYETYDGGVSWRVTYTLEGGKTLYHAKFLESGDIVIVGQEGTIMNISGARVRSSGITRKAAITSSDLYCLVFTNKHFGVTVGADGTKLYTNDGGVTWSETFNGNSPKNKPDIGKIETSNYPNPFNPSTKISFVLPFDAFVILKVYDINGREVATLLNSTLKAGANTANFDGSKLSSGVYIYRLTAVNGLNQMTKTQKMILAK